MSDDLKKHLAAQAAAQLPGVLGGAASSIFTAPHSGTYKIVGSTTVIGKIWKQDWTEDQWIAHFQELEQYPEAAKAMKLYNSKLYKALK